MTSKRIPVGFPDALYRDLEMLAKKWGLDLTNTIRHAVARAVDEELKTREDPPPPPKNQRGSNHFV